MKIGICAKNYPSLARPHQGTFLYGLVQDLQALGARVTVISPQPVMARRTGRMGVPYGPESALVSRPRFISCSVRRAGSVRLGHLTSKSFRTSASRAVRALDALPDLFYGHFLFLGGEAAVELGGRYQRPAVIALGESDITRYEQWLGLDHVSGVAARASGLVCVSPTLQDYCANVLRVAPERLLLAPNGVDCGRFAPQSRRAARELLGLPQDRFILSFVGHFNERKGPHRVLEAMTRSRHDPLGVFLGDGPLQPAGQSVLHAGPVSHSAVSSYLNASDLFVLPSLAEGSCNALLEALACGLPVVSSDIRSIREDLGDRPPVFLTDPRDPEQLAAEIDRVIDLVSSSGGQMSRWARRMAERRDLRLRATRILDWLGSLQRSAE